MLTIVKSNMTFGPFPDENVFYIEKEWLSNIQNTLEKIYKPK